MKIIEGEEKMSIDGEIQGANSDPGMDKENIGNFAQV